MTAITAARQLPKIRDAVRTLGRALSGMALRAAERLVSPQREVPSEYYRFPLY